jgi:putative transposase
LEDNTDKAYSCNMVNHPHHPSAELKLNTLHRCFELGKDVEYVSRKIGYSRCSIYKWRRRYLEKGAIGLMSSNKNIKREPLAPKQIQEPFTSKTAEDFQEQINKLQLEVDVLRETINVLRKDPSVDMTNLSNREKAVVVSALKEKYTLSLLLYELGLPRSSYFYQISVMKQPDEYVEQRTLIKNTFQENRGCYGYRRIWKKLQHQGIIISEKLVRKIMKEESLVVRFVNKRKYQSYQGEISPEVGNIISQDFHTDVPNTKWLTDITEFALLDGKVYFSPMLDCFDGLVVSWTIRTSPKAELVNSMLNAAISGLRTGELPIIHTDRGCHYRWPGWIERMEKAGLTCSMSKKGCLPDNSACEGFFGRLKNEMFYGKSWAGISIEHFDQHLDSYIKWYNE